jgi:hypothetical protein
MNQRRLRAKVANLERMQQLRIDMIEKKKDEYDDLIERKGRELNNLKSQLTIGVVR